MLAENLAQQIKEQEAAAKAIIADAKARAAEIVAIAQTEAERSIKNTRQRCHRQLRESTADAEKEAGERAAVILRDGESDAKALYEREKSSAEGVAAWLVREVISTYGSCRDD